MSGSQPVSWDGLSHEGSIRRGEFRVKDSGVAASAGNALLALDNYNLRHLLIPIRAGVVVEVDDRSSGVHILGRRLVDDTGETSFVDVACLKPHLVEIFAHLVTEILETLPADPGRPAAVARRVLNRWRELLERDRPGLLSEEELIGLFGELCVLRRIAERSATATSAWAGPTGARFDFQRGALCLEVKTTSSRARTLAHIHGVDQLEAPPTLELFVVVVTVEAMKGAGHSVPDLLMELGSLGLDALELSAKLHAIGYSSHDAPYYADQRFSVRSVQYFHVDASFPRIVRASFVGGDLPAAVENLRYTIDLTSPPPQPLDLAAIDRLLFALAS